MPTISLSGAPDQSFTTLEFQGVFNKISNQQIGNIKFVNEKQVKFQCGSNYLTGNVTQPNEQLIVFRKNHSENGNELICVGKVAKNIVFNQEPDFYE
ncbi:Conserved_hypothetical protein [Hexamita inflata]|uniref:Uncharacterized protein n=1 Tax=Hexamita inflata TaxID=28002 RepID=A0AA86V2P4_9EUKA|nr:Conserved hypothetical protein [Hexamita inflata]